MRTTKLAHVGLLYIVGQISFFFQTVQSEIGVIVIDRVWQETLRKKTKYI